MAQPVDFAAHLHAQGFRLTPQRQLIPEAVRQADDHVTPFGLCCYCRVVQQKGGTHPTR